MFVFYTMGGNDPYHMPLNAFTSFLDDAGIPDPDSLSVKRSDCDTVFIVCNFQPDKNSSDVAVNDEHAMMRFEFMEALVRLGESAQSQYRAQLHKCDVCKRKGPIRQADRTAGDGRGQLHLNSWLMMAGRS
jgi:hypothetical protein